MGRGSPIYKKTCRQIVEQFQNNGPQRKIGKTLNIASSTLYNIIKRFRECGEICAQVTRPEINTGCP